MTRTAAPLRRLAAMVAPAIALAVALLGAPGPALAAATPAPADANRHQLVVVVRYAGDATGDGDTGLNAPYPYGDNRTRFDAKLAELNGAPTATTQSPTLYSYLKTVSLGSCRLASHVPQYDEATGRVAYLTLPGARDSYKVSESIAADAVAAFSAAYPSFDATSLDGDGDGLVDNVLVVLEVGDDAPANGDAAWPRHANLGQATAVGSAAAPVRAYDYTLVDTAHLVGVGTVAHETLHVFGARDLYRMDANVPAGRGLAVGVWDIMAQHGGSKLMWPLAITRADCGWATVSEAGPGTHTLHAATSGKTQAVAVRSPLSDSEYFVVEYRRANTNPADLSALDTSQEGSPMTIGGTGLLVYRVNPAAKAEGNKGARDYVYLFRPGETGEGRGDGAGDVRHAQLSLAGRASLGSADLSAGLADGAITFSDGQNSGITVRVTSETPDSATFELAVAPAADGLWTVAAGAAGQTPLPAADVVETKVAAAGTRVFQAVQTGFGSAARVTAQVFDGSSWTAAASVCSAMDLKAVACSGDTRYVLAASYGGAGSFAVFSQTGSGPWTRLAQGTGQVNSPDLAVVGGTPYVLADIPGSAGVWRVEGSSLVAVGPRLPVGYVATGSVVDVAGSPAVFLADFDASSAGLWRLDGGAWKRAWGRSGSFNGSSAVSVGGQGYVYVKDQDGAGAVLRVPASGEPEWRALPSSVPAALEGSLAVAEGRLYLAASSMAGNHVTVWGASPADLGAWGQLGLRVVSPAQAVGAAGADGRLYVATLADGAAGLRWHGVEEGDDGPAATPLTSVSVLGGARTWNGRAHTPSVSVRAGGREVPASGYTVSYKNNVAVGTASVVVTGRGAYAGTLRATFTIAAGKAGWLTVDGVRRWSTGSGWGSGWLTTGGQTYWLRGDGNRWGPAGSVATGWITVDGQTFFLRRADNQWGPKGSVGSGWLDEGGHRYFLRRSGSPYGPKGSIGTGWLDEGGHRYFLRRADSSYGPKGSIGSGWLNEGGRRYFLRRAGSPYGPKGSVGYGWLTDGGRRYYLSRPTGAALTGRHVVGGRAYLFDGQGAVV